MSLWWYFKTLAVSAFKGWAIVWTGLLLWSVLGLVHDSRHDPWNDILFYLGVYLTCTAAVLLATTLLFVAPYLRLVGIKLILLEPWRAFLVPMFVALGVSIGLGAYFRAPVDSILEDTWPYAAFALANAAISSAFYVRTARRLIDVSDL